MTAKTSGDVIIANAGKKGRGVFALRNFKKGEVIEVAPVIVIEQKEFQKMNSPTLMNYFYQWGDDGEQAALPLGSVLMLNHSNHANCDYEMNHEHRTFTVIAYKDIDMGAELTVNYNGDPEDDEPAFCEPGYKDQTKKQRRK
jgi:SET domain-containing protein